MSIARRAFSCTFVVLLVALVAAPSGARTYRDYFRYAFPPPNARFVDPDATLIIRPLDAHETTYWARSLRVRGTRSGDHTGRWTTSDDGKTLIFTPERPFAAGERVRVSVDQDSSPGFAWSFEISAAPKIDTSTLDLSEGGYGRSDYTPQPRRAAGARSVSAPSYSLPSDFAQLNVTINDNPDDGYLFLATSNQPGPNYMMIVDNTGAPVYFRKTVARMGDFKKQPNGLLTYFDRSSLSRSFAMDNTYTIVDDWIPGNGYFSADNHDFLILANGHALLMIYDAQTVDMSTVVRGGQVNATVIGLVIQELDTSKNVVFQWRSWDHFQITDSSVDLRATLIDYVHGNSMDVTPDGNILLSSRHLDEVTKIDRQTGDIIWRMGGKQNQFTLVGASEWFNHQHDARWLANDHLTVFNNGNNNTIQESSAIEYAVDEVNKTATMVWQFRDTPPRFAAFTGNAQRLPNGNTLISWGNLGVVTEVRPDGTKAFEMNFVDPGNRTYRTFRFPWSGVAAAPTLWAETGTTDVTLHFTKFGDDNVDHYNVYTSPYPDAATPAGSTAASAFTLTDVNGGELLYCRVTSVDPSSVESPYSNEVLVQIPDVPLPVLITSFEARPVDGAVELSWAISADEDLQGYKIMRATDAGPPEWISGPELIPTAAMRYEDRGVRPGETYQHTLAVVLGDGSEMLSQGVTTTVRASKLALHQNHPNPFNPTTVISFVLPAEARVELSIYDVRGALVRRLIDGVMAAGPNEVAWDGRDSSGRAVGSGIYFYQLANGSHTLTRKMALLK